MKVLRCLVAGVMAVTLAVGAVTANAQMGFSFDNPLLNQKAPEFTLRTLDGSNKSMTQSREGQNVILFFWATWCPHCRTQLKELSAQKSLIESKGIKVFLVDVGEPADDVKGYIQKNNIAYDVFLDADSVVSEQYNVIGVPTFFFIDKQGVVKGVEHSIPSGYDKIFG